MRLTYRQHGWEQLIAASTPKTRREEMRYLIQDPNLGKDLAAGKFKVLACDKVAKDTYRVAFSAKKPVIEQLVGIFGFGQYYTLNGKRRRT